MERDVASYRTIGDSNKESAVVDMVLGLLCFYYAVFADFPDCCSPFAEMLYGHFLQDRDAKKRAGNCDKLLNTIIAHSR
jgi:hypothetical protein